MYAASRNGELSRMLAQMSNVFARVSILVRPAKDRLANNQMHQQILAALKAGRKQRAVRLFEKMGSSLYELISQLPDEGTALPKLEGAPQAQRGNARRSPRMTATA